MHTSTSQKVFTFYTSRSAVLLSNVRASPFSAECGSWAPGGVPEHYVTPQCVGSLLDAQPCRMICANLAACSGISFSPAASPDCKCVLYMRASDKGRGQTYGHRLESRAPCEKGAYRATSGAQPLSTNISAALPVNETSSELATHTVISGSKTEWQLLTRHQNPLFNSNTNHDWHI